MNLRSVTHCRLFQSRGQWSKLLVLRSEKGGRGKLPPSQQEVVVGNTSMTRARMYQYFVPLLHLHFVGVTSAARTVVHTTAPGKIDFMILRCKCFFYCWRVRRKVSVARFHTGSETRTSVDRRNKRGALSKQCIARTLCIGDFCRLRVSTCGPMMAGVVSGERIGSVRSLYKAGGGSGCTRRLRRTLL